MGFWHRLKALYKDQDSAGSGFRGFLAVLAIALIWGLAFSIINKSFLPLPAALVVLGVYSGFYLAISRIWKAYKAWRYKRLVAGPQFDCFRYSADRVRAVTTPQIDQKDAPEQP